jgi:hypothetical protein
MTGRSKSHNRSRSSSRSRMSRRSQQGGSQGAYPDSAWGFQMNNLGNGWTQFMNSLSSQNSSTSQSNNIVPVRNMPAQNTGKMSGGKRHMSGSGGKRHMSGSGGKRHRKRGQMMGQSMGQSMSQSKSRGKNGGYWGAVLEQAAVPLALLGIQHAYGKRYTRRHGSPRNKSFRRGR